MAGSYATSILEPSHAHDPDTLLALTLNGERLHIDHGYPVRLISPNRPGVIAQLALELGRAGGNITDMALYPTEDRSSGVVALWIAGEVAAGRATELLGELGYPVARP